MNFSKSFGDYFLSMLYGAFIGMVLFFYLLLFCMIFDWIGASFILASLKMSKVIYSFNLFRLICALTLVVLKLVIKV